MFPPTFDYPITFLYTDDLEQTAHFYERVLNLPLARDQGTCRIYRVGTGYVGFCQRADAPRQPAGIIFTLVTQDVDGWFLYLSGRGVPFDMLPAYNKTYRIYHCFLRDPNGYLIEIQRFDDPL